MIYQLFSENKFTIVNNFTNSDKIRFPAILLIGQSGVGKRITAFHIIKKIFNENATINIFYNQNFCYLAKNFPFDELSFLVNQLNQENEILITKEIAFEKLKFTLLRFLVPFINRISEIDEKYLDPTFYDDSSYIFYRLKNIKMSDENDFKILLSLSDKIIKNRKLFKSDRIYLSEIKNIQKWIENTYQIGKRIVLIDNIEFMQDESANSFLKTLEEPDQNLLFILTSTSKSYLLPTITSRCAIFELDRIKEDELKKILENEWKINFNILRDQPINSFYDFFNILKSDINNYIKSVKDTFDLFFSPFNKFHLFYENISTKKDLSFFLRQLILYCENILKNYQDQNIVIASEISYEKVVRILSYLNKIEDFTKKYNYPIDNALVFSYINRKQILSGDYSGEKIIL